MAQATLLERNKAVALRFKKAQGTPEEEAAMKEVLAPGYKRLRGGLHHLAANAQGQGFPATGSFLRGAFPDRVDVIEEVIAEGDQVGMLFRFTGTHRGNLFGIPPTGRRSTSTKSPSCASRTGRWSRAGSWRTRRPC
jgi:hypothetical protein